MFLQNWATPTEAVWGETEQQVEKSIKHVYQMCIKCGAVQIEVSFLSEWKWKKGDEKLLSKVKVKLD